ncbi:hypothetical protein [Xanthomonas axonopodis]|uniref:Secreted protein n=1 Tax=Xanthomonas axonopodis pv. cajani TaxID=487827 RepID=A0ABX3MCE2_9XANT|nr:hypothetical protein [Xanthomonas axonopodis]OOX13825.1 hypothetical protein Xcaj_07770 [Xanthomonas axonopodis pv. cajani]
MKRPLLIAAALLAVLGAVSLLKHDWKPSMPDGDYGTCQRSHVENGFIMMYQSMCTGTSCTQIPYVVPTTTAVCDEWQYPLGDGPEFQAAYADYRKRLSEWYTRHLEEAP